MIRILSRWNHSPRNYWNLMSIFFWYKNAAVIEREHPMIAGFFRLKSRLSRRPGYAIDPLPVHLWKRTRDVARLFIAWVKFLKEMEEVWLQTRKKSEREEYWLAEIQRIQGEIWQVLKIGEWQKVYNHARGLLPAKAKASLDPFEELSSKVLLTSKDLNKFLKRWEGLQLRIEELRAHLSREGEAARRSLDEMSELHTSIQPGSRIREWQEAYSRLRQSLPPKFHLSHVKFDALSNRPICSRQDLQKFWADTMRQLRGMRFWNIRPWKMTVAFIEDLALTASFAFTFKNSKASSRE